MGAYRIIKNLKHLSHNDFSDLFDDRPGTIWKSVTSDRVIKPALGGFFYFHHCRTVCCFLAAQSRNFHDHTP